MKLYKISILVFSVILIIALILSVKFAFISADAPYYLSVARDISNGLIPYKDINSAYTPLMMYINSLVYSVIEQPSYALFLVLQYLVIAASSVMLYIISIKKLLLENYKAILLSLFFFISVLSSDGTYIILEVYSILFVMIAFLAIMNERFILSGTLLAVTFFFKQYGLLNFIPFYLLISYSGNNQISKAVKFSIGGLIPLIVFLVYFSLIEGVQIKELFFQISGQGYGENSIASGMNLKSILIGGKVFLMLALSLIVVRFNPLKSPLAKVLLVGVLISLLPIIVQSYQHYWLNSFPYLFILLALAWQNENFKLSLYLYGAMALIAGLIFLRVYQYKSKGNVQLQIASQIEKYYPAGSTVFLHGDIRYLYLLNDYKNPVLKEIGYVYAFKPNEDFIINYKVISDSNMLKTGSIKDVKVISNKYFIY